MQRSIIIFIFVIFGMFESGCLAEHQINNSYYTQNTITTNVPESSEYVEEKTQPIVKHKKHYVLKNKKHIKKKRKYLKRKVIKRKVIKKRVFKKRTTKKSLLRKKKKIVKKNIIKVKKIDKKIKKLTKPSYNIDKNNKIYSANSSSIYNPNKLKKLLFNSKKHFKAIKLVRKRLKPEYSKKRVYKKRRVAKQIKRKMKLQLTATAYTSHRGQTDKTPFLAAWNNRIKPGMKVIAVSRDLIKKHGLKNGTVVRIKGIKHKYVVKDKMNARFKKRIDIYMGLDKKRAKKWGKRKVTLIW